LTPVAVFLDEGLTFEDDVIDPDDFTAPDSACHLAKSVMSLSAGTCHFLLIASHRAPSAFASSFEQKVRLDKFSGLPFYTKGCTGLIGLIVIFV